MTTAIIDYGSGNLRSAVKAFERATAEAGLPGPIHVTSSAEVVAAADRIVLPGVGAFGNCRAGLGALPGMWDALEDAVIHKGRPFLGICVGMQLMADRGLEHGGADGFGWIAGEVRPLDPSCSQLKVPHMGWNDLQVNGEGQADDAGHPVLAEISPGDHVYFVHSFGFVCAHAKHRLAHVDYGGPVSAVIGRDNMIGTQFHPEKSQAVGLKFIENFLRWRP